MKITIVYESKECFLDEKLCVKHYEFGAGGYQVVALVKLEELNKYLALILLCKKEQTFCLSQQINLIIR